LAGAIHWLVTSTGLKASAAAGGGAVGGFAVGGPVGAVAGAGFGYSFEKQREASAAGHGSNMVMEPGAQLLRYFFGGSGGGGGGVRSSGIPFASAGGGRHNPFNLRVPGSTTAFQTFGSDAEGVKAAAHQLQLYENRDKLNTIAGIITKFAPPNENDTAGYIKAVAERTKIGANDPLDPANKDQLASILSAMALQENRRANAGFSKEVIINILNNTGGSAVVASSQLPH